MDKEIKRQDLVFIQEMLEEVLRIATSYKLKDSDKISRIIQIVRNALDFHKIILKSGDESVMEEKCSLDRIINYAISLVEYQMRTRNITISMTPINKEITIKGNEHNLIRALLYVLMEIIKAKEKGITSYDISIDYRIIDETIDILFFFPRSISDRPSLSYIESIITQYQGKVDYYSEKKQSVLTITLPVYQVKPLSERKLKVLVIDDDPLIRDLFTDFLEMLGEDGIVTDSHQEALEIIKREKPDLVLVDYRMPKRTGIDFLNEAMLYIDKDRLCLLTGEASSFELINYKNEKGINILEKPITLTKFKNFLAFFKATKCSM